MVGSSNDYLNKYYFTLFITSTPHMSTYPHPLRCPGHVVLAGVELASGNSAYGACSLHWPCLTCVPAQASPLQRPSILDHAPCSTTNGTSKSLRRNTQRAAKHSSLSSSNSTSIFNHAAILNLSPLYLHVGVWGWLAGVCDWWVRTLIGS